jgi:MFS family permease
VFIGGTGVAVVTGSYGVLVVARVVTGAVQGVFIAAAFAAGTAVVPVRRMGRAIAVVMSGVAVSGAVGVPLGTVAGQVLGWRGSFAAAVVVAGVAWLVTVLVVALGQFSAAATVLTGLIIAVIAIPVAWASRYLEPPAAADATQPAAAPALALSSPR